MEKLSPIGKPQTTTTPPEEGSFQDIINTTAKKAVAILSDDEMTIEEVESKSVTYTSMLYNAAETIFYPLEVAYEIFSYPVTGTYEWFCHFFINGDHPWKQAKYQFSLQQLQKAALEMLVEENDTSLGQQFKHFQDELYDREKKYGSDYRSQWKGTLSALEKALSPEVFKPDGNEEIYEALLKITAAFYLNNHLFSFVESVLYGFIESGSSRIDKKTEEFGIEDISKSIYHASWKLKKAKIVTMINNIPGAWGGLNFNPIEYGNIPCVMYSQNFLDTKSKLFSVTFFRSGTPTIGKSDPDDPSATAVINPIFETLLKYLEQTGETLFYVILQSPTMGSDKGRVDAIKKMQRKYPHVLKIAIIDQDSPNFYHQLDEYYDKDDAKTFKQDLYDEMVERIKAEYEFPEELLRNKKFLVDLQLIIDHMHEDVYKNQEKLTRDERLGFIDNINSPLIRLMIRYLKPNYVFKGCKDTIDRTGKCEGLYMNYNLALAGYDTEESQREVTVNSLGFSIQVKKQHMHGERKHRYIIADAHLQDPEVRENIYRRHKEYGVIPDKNPHQIKKDPDQAFDMSID